MSYSHTISHVNPAGVHGHSCDARLQLETPGPGGAGIHDEARARVFDERLMRVAEHDDVRSVSRQQLFGRRTTAELMAVTDVD